MLFEVSRKLVISTYKLADAWEFEQILSQSSNRLVERSELFAGLFGLYLVYRVACMLNSCFLSQVTESSVVR